MYKAPVAAVEINRITPEGYSKTDDLLAVEEPLAIEVGYSLGGERRHRQIAVTMRTPGNDFELALGFLLTEGIVRGMEQVTSIRHCHNQQSSEYEGNIIKVELAEGVALPAHIAQRHSFISSSCGICGKASIESVRMYCAPAPSDDGTVMHSTIIHSLPGLVRKSQRVFGVTGGIHAAALFSTGGELLFLREDVGRHNAVDKLIGKALSDGALPLNGRVLFLSGRASFELIQKAALAGVRVICAVGAPSSLAVDCAKNLSLTLVGFLRQERFNVYSGPWRIHFDSVPSHTES